MTRQSRQINFSSDLEQSQVLTRYLEQHFYSKHPLEGMTDYQINRTRGNDNGCDVILHFNTDKWIIDEKAAIHYDQTDPNKFLNSFVLEILSFANQDSTRTGWFINDAYETTHYLFIWPSSNDSSLHYHSNGRAYTDFRDNIKSLEVLLVSRRDLINHLRTNYNVCFDSLEDKAREMVATNTSCHMYASGLKLLHSNGVYEMPVNLLVPKKVYMEIAILHGHISNV